MQTTSTMLNAAKDGFRNFRGEPFRRYQEEATKFILESDKRFVVLEAPTGCIAGETVINLNRGRLGRPTTVERAFEHSHQFGQERYNWDMTIPTYIRSYNGEAVRLAIAENFSYSGMKAVMKLVLEDGACLRATPDHLIMTERGYARMDTLCADDLVLCDTMGTKKLSSKKKKTNDTPVCNLWLHPFAGKCKTSKDARGYTMKVEIHRATYEAFINNISLDEYKRILRFDQEAAGRLIFIDPSIFHIHHKDGNHKNNAIGNLEKLPNIDHRRLHSVDAYRNFSQGIVKRVRVVYVVEDGYAETYDISVPENMNFVANGIIVHNSGKSLIAMTAGMASGGMTYMVHSKMLQNQITESFPEAKSLFGRANYFCLKDERPQHRLASLPSVGSATLTTASHGAGTGSAALDNGHRLQEGAGRTCAECTHTRRYPCRWKKDGCPYAEEKRLLLAAKLKILNFDYYLSEVNYVGRLEGQPFIVIDEADNLENTLINFMTLTFTKYALGRLGIGMPERKTTDSKLGIAPWVNFGEMAKYRAIGIIKKLGMEIDSFGEITQDYQVAKIKEYERLNGLLGKVSLFLDNVDDTWMFQEAEGGGISFRPLWVTEKMAEMFMWGHGEHGGKWVLMSASFLPPAILAKTLGIPRDEIDYLCVQSTFPPERRPIHIEAVGNLTAKTMDSETPKVVERVGEILDAHPDEKGLVHCVSYKLGAALMNGLKNTKHAERLVMHDSGSKQEVFDAFVEDSGNKVMISPSMERGVSLDQELCRFVIILKAPFLYLGDKIVATRVYSGQTGQLWYTAQMLLTALQMSGRAMRSEDDYCTTYILDTNFSKTLNRNAKLLPMWWREAIV
jgi:ATP-dependent DNA helicase DinG